eukprot:TRINITY_DN1284_c0_g1_i3.p1 TRINITY_DN1284_c0_g1~~TRINITY_DN1284_c0_g1_i3.p1  ORF type:complete len:196 (-),score=52.57 TRINITY_DN1284_c0_g1_i3:149-736(-)
MSPLILILTPQVGKQAFVDPNDPFSEKAREFFTCPTDLPKLSYLEQDCLVPFSSINVWKATNDALISNDIIEADSQKKIVEAEQRLRQKQKRAERRMHEGRYFFAKDPTPVELLEKDLAEGETLPHQEFPSPVGRFYRTVPSLQWTFRDNFHSVETDFDELRKAAVEETASREKLLKQAQEAAAAAGEDGNCIVM